MFCGYDGSCSYADQTALEDSGTRNRPFGYCKGGHIEPYTNFRPSADVAGVWLFYCSKSSAAIYITFLIMNQVKDQEAPYNRDLDDRV